MKLHGLKRKLAVVLGVVALSLPGLRAGAADATTELNALVAKINADIAAGKRTEKALAADLKQFDVLLAEHKGEKTDAVARILYMKAMLYGEVLGNEAKAQEFLDQLKADFKDTPFVAGLEKRNSLEAGTQFPDFSVTDVAGQPLSVASHKGKVVLIDFWATWCGPCRMQLPYAITAYQKYHAKGFDIIGVSLDDNKTQLLSFIKDEDMPWPQYFDGLRWDNKLAVKYGIQAIPASFLLDRSGKIIAKDLEGDALEQAVAAALAKN